MARFRIEGMAPLELGPKLGGCFRGSLHLLRIAAGPLPKPREITYFHLDHQSLTLQSPLLPPVFSINLVSRRTRPLDRDLHMSYTVSAATLAPVIASISTPVRPCRLTRQSMIASSPSMRTSMLQSS